MRVPASEVEGLVLDQNCTISWLADMRSATPLLRWDLMRRDLQRALERAANSNRSWIEMPPEEMRALLRRFVTRVTLSARSDRRHGRSLPTQLGDVARLPR